MHESLPQLIPQDISDKLNMITSTRRQAGKFVARADKMMGRIADVNDEAVARFQAMKDNCKVVLSTKTSVDMMRALLANLASFASRSTTFVKESESLENDFQIEFGDFALGETYANVGKSFYRQCGDAFYNELEIHED